MNQLTLPGHPFQYAWHVPDMEKAIDYWAEILGVGPFFITEFDSNATGGILYRGKKSNLQMRVAWAQGKEGQIELIEVNSSAPNVYHDLVDPARVAFHHVGIWSADYQQDRALLESQGLEVAMDMAPSNICYFDTASRNGAMLELIERNDGIVGLFGMIAKAAEAWDGSQPARALTDLT